MGNAMRKFDDDETDIDDLEEMTVSDPRWYELTRPLYAYLLVMPRAWTDLYRWGRRTGLTPDQVTTLIAALDHRHEAYSIGRRRNVRWCAVVRRTRRECRQAALMRPLLAKTTKRPLDPVIVARLRGRNTEETQQQ